jgi:hypothetical protein
VDILVDQLRRYLVAIDAAMLSLRDMLDVELKVDGNTSRGRESESSSVAEKPNKLNSQRAGAKSTTSPRR